MEDKTANIISISVIILLIVILVIARVILKLTEPFFLICGAAIAAILAVIALYIVRRRFHARKRLLESKYVADSRELRIEYSFLRKVAGVPRKFQYRDLEKATDGFGSLLGRGSSGSVFKGLLSDGTVVAVKRIEGNERGEKEFKSEVAAIASVQHVNLAHLVGYCSPIKGNRFLVYEFFPNSSLDNWIFPKTRTSNSSSMQPHGMLSWELRYQVVLDVAKALSYLHHDCRSCILHLDIKPENILLDMSYRGLVTDFGLSKLMGKEESNIVTNIRGTRGYLAPEWLLENGVSSKCDVYSFGMVVLEIIGGRRSIRVIENTSHDKKTRKKFDFFPKIVNEKYRQGRLMEVVDKRIVDEGGIVDRNELHRLVCVALWCIQEKPKVRPSMKLVVEMLEDRVELEDPPDTHMMVVDMLSVDRDSRTPPKIPVRARLRDDDSSSSGAYSVSLSILSGR